VDGVVYFGTAHTITPFPNYLNALDASTGDVLWRYEAAGLVGSRPAVVDGVVYFGMQDTYRGTGEFQGSLYAVDASTGDLIWRYETGKDGALGEVKSPAVVDGVVYFSAYDYHVYALDLDIAQEKPAQ